MSKSKSKSTEAPEMMDPSAKEVDASQVVSANNKRTCYALKQLIAETLALFPETPYEVSNYDGRNTGLDVTFDLTTLDAEEGQLLADLLGLIGHDERVLDVIHEDDAVLVQIRPGARIQDDRSPFGLADALTVLAASDNEGIFLDGSL